MTPPSSLWTLRSDRVQEIKSFIDQLAEARGGVDAGLIPSATDVASLLENALWATTLADEGRYPRFSLVFGPPPPGSLRVQARPLVARNIAKLAPTLVSDLSRIGVQRTDRGDLEIWGIAPGWTSCVEVLGIAPGYLIVRMGPHNLAVFRHAEYLPLVRNDPARGIHGMGRDHAAAIIGETFATDLSPERQAVTGLLLLMIADAMRAQGNGGSLLVLPHDVERRRRALEWIDLGQNAVGGITLEGCFDKYLPQLQDTPDPLAAAAAIPGIGNYLNRRKPVDHTLLDQVAVVGQLTGVDGAVVFGDRLELVGFGAMIRAPQRGEAGSPDFIHRRSLLAYSNPDQKGEQVAIASVGGARRQSAARFVVNNYDSLAITASHDGPVSLALWMARDEETNGPRAHLMTDIETLLD